MVRAFETLDDIVDNGFCIGCGLCKALAPSGGIEMEEAANGHLRPRAARTMIEAEEAAIMRLCPGINVQGPFGEPLMNADPVWGALRRVAVGYAGDPEIRHVASSGGIMTAVSRHLLESGRVKGVLHVRPDPDNALGSLATLSRSADEARRGMGSRYASCSTLETILDVLALGEPIAVSMKPCDIAAIRNLQREDERARELIRFTMALFCGTVPNLKASLDFLARRGLERDEVSAFRWRGHGCPGPTWARTRDGREFEGRYREFWVDNPWTTQFRCKICPDAIGLQADLAVGDAWPGGWPQGEDPGWNAVVAHTDIGETVLSECEDTGGVVLDESDVALLNDVQPHHVDLRSLLAARLAAAQVAGLPAPNFRHLALDDCAAHIDPDLLGRNFAGTLKRLRQGHGDEPTQADYATDDG